MKIIKTILIYVSIAISIAGLSWVSSFYRIPGRQESLVILGSGLAFGLLYRMGAKVLPALFVGMVSYGFYFREFSLPVSLWLTCSMLLSSWLGILYIRKNFSNDLIERPICNFLHFYFAALVISPLADTIFLLPIVWLTDLVDITKDIRIYFFSIIFGEALGALVIAPAVMLFGSNYHLKYRFADFRNLQYERNLWMLSALCLLFLTLLLGEHFFYAGILDAELLLFPMMVWSALRLGVIFTNFAVAIISLTVFTFHFFSISGTAGGMDIPQVLGMLLLIITLAVMGQLVAASSLERRKQTATLEDAVNHDFVTGLPNIRNLNQHLEPSTAGMNKAASELILGYVSICNYEALAHGYGLEARNALYCQFGGFLKQHLDSGIEIFRISGPSFALLFKGKHQDQASLTMNNLIEKVRHFNFIWRERPFHINAVLSMVPVNGLPGEFHGPLEYASALADRAYNQGSIGALATGNENDQLSTRHKERADWLAKLNKALAEDLFYMVAQPVVKIDGNIESGAGLHFEVLLRLQDDNGGEITPIEFIPHAEAFNLMPNIDRWVINHVLRWLSSPQVDLEKVALCSINLSGQSIDDQQFNEDIERLFKKYNVPANKICFEITETSAIRNMHNASTFVLNLQDMGCSVALDDFGSGLSSFEYLKRFPMNYLKIDGVFIQNLADSQIDYVIVDAFWRVANTMKLKTVAEFVESREILDILSELGVDYAQGFYFGRPVPLKLLGEVKADYMS